MKIENQEVLDAGSRFYDLFVYLCGYRVTESFYLIKYDILKQKNVANSVLREKSPLQ